MNALNEIGGNTFAYMYEQEHLNNKRIIRCEYCDRDISEKQSIKNDGLCEKCLENRE